MLSEYRGILPPVVDNDVIGVDKITVTLVQNDLPICGYDEVIKAYAELIKRCKEEVAKVDADLKGYNNLSAKLTIKSDIEIISK